MKHFEALKNLGLNEIESKIYVTLLEKGAVQANSIAKIVGTKRTTIYAILHSLCDRGILTTIVEKKKTFYSAEKPYHLAGIFQKKLQNFESMVPFLESLEKKNTEVFGFQFIETMSELKNFYTHILVEYKNKDYATFGDLHQWERLDKEFFEQYQKDRARANIHNYSLLTMKSSTINPTNPTLLKHSKYLPDKYTTSSFIDIFGDKLLMLHPGLSSPAVIITIPPMLESFQLFFQMLWEVYAKK